MRRRPAHPIVLPFVDTDRGKIVVTAGFLDNGHERTPAVRVERFDDYDTGRPPFDPSESKYLVCDEGDWKETPAALAHQFFHGYKAPKAPEPDESRKRVESETYEIGGDTYTLYLDELDTNRFSEHSWAVGLTRAGTIVYENRHRERAYCSGRFGVVDGILESLARGEELSPNYASADLTPAIMNLL